jgi:MPBQ/MSBQ methyltransferase
VAPRCAISSTRPASQPRFIQHKKEAFWFYRLLSIVYDHVINVGHWTEDMRDGAFKPAASTAASSRSLAAARGSPYLGIVKHQNPLLLCTSKLCLYEKCLF